MTQQWKVGSANVPWELAVPYGDARLRCLNSPALYEHILTIMDDAWGDDADHLRWVNTARVSEIVAWAETIAKDNA